MESAINEKLEEIIKALKGVKINRKMTLTTWRIDCSHLNNQWTLSVINLKTIRR